ncbi:hypothetical protein D6D15_09429 [Aureobasidium pullulans]|uniref:BTB domain-containing protein n=1 Tax=Aureobasidium pullulans TaxID=5580 RepID=A0A4S9AUA6_AURPU|nr:hypothetical protein D6D15_09429 [Aureobasidium pullulans]
MITSPFIRALMRVLGPTAVGVSDSFQEEVFEIHSHRDYFFNNETFSDIILEFGPFKIHAHKVILASNSTWFEKAFSSGFSEATQTTIDLGNEEDPKLLFAMLNHFYNDDYNNHIGQNDPIRDHSTLHLEVFLLADMYDAPSLRDAAKQRFIRGMTNAAKWHSPIHDEQVEVFRRVVGLDAVQFADVSLQEEMFCVLEMYVREIMQTPRVVVLVGRGEMFSQEFAERFAKRISALLEC